MVKHLVEIDDLLVLLASGKSMQDYASISNFKTTGMLPYNGRPVIYQIILDWIEAGGKKVVITLPKSDLILEKFVTSSFSKRVELEFIYIVDGNKYLPVEAFQVAVSRSLFIKECVASVYLLYTDILVSSDVLYKNKKEGDLIVFVDSFLDSDKYTYIDTKSLSLVDYEFVKESVDFVDYGAIYTDIGAYKFDGIQLHLTKIINDRFNSIFELLVSFASSVSFETAEQKWSDLGHIDTATSISTKLIGARVFNSLTIDESRGIIKKTSDLRAFKILQEINYYSKIPASLSIWFPRMLEFNIGNNIAYSLEYYPYKTLSEFFVFYSLSAVFWKKVFSKIRILFNDFNYYRGPIYTKLQLKKFYWEKTLNRVEELNSASKIYSVINQPNVLINGKTYPSWLFYKEKINAYLDIELREIKSTFVHGDLCLSNILYAPLSDVIKVIDPRGEMFEEGIWGDFYYDLAKLFHSIHGKYDFIIHDMFLLNEINEQYHFEILTNANSNHAFEVLMSILPDNISVKLVVVLEILLFLSMLPLHSDHPKRQIAFYLTALMLLDEVFNENLY